MPPGQGARGPAGANSRGKINRVSYYRYWTYWLPARCKNGPKWGPKFRRRSHRGEARGRTERETQKKKKKKRKIYQKYPKIFADEKRDNDGWKSPASTIRTTVSPVTPAYSRGNSSDRLEIL